MNKMVGLENSHSPTFSNSLKFDLLAGVVVALIAIPLCLGIALASGAPIISGIVAGIIGGIVVTTLSGSSIAVSGPAAGLAVVCLNTAVTLGSFEALLTAIIIAGAVQLLFAALKLGGIAEFVPNSVIKGMLAGIGCLLIIKQAPYLIGASAEHSYNLSVAMVGVPALVLIFVWEKFVPKKSLLQLLMPAPLLAVLFGVGAVFGLSKMGYELPTGGKYFVQLPLFGSVSELLSALPQPDWSAVSHPMFVQSVIVLAVIASIETLLSIEAGDKIDPYRRSTNTDRELMAQGVGNIASGFLGGLPITAVIVRSSANVYAGARTRTSSFIHGCVILTALMVLPTLFNRIPLAALAAVLMVVGWKLTSFKLLKTEWKEGQNEWVPFLATLVGVVGIDLLIGVLIGVGFGIYSVIKTNFHGAIHTEKLADKTIIHLAKDVSFLNKGELKRVLQGLENGKPVVIDASKSRFIDHDVAESLAEFRQQAQYRGIAVTFVDFERRTLPLVSRKRHHSKKAGVAPTDDRRVAV